MSERIYIDRIHERLAAIEKRLDKCFYCSAAPEEPSGDGLAETIAEVEYDDDEYQRSVDASKVARDALDKLK